MICKPFLCTEIFAGRKTVTRRAAEASYEVGKIVPLLPGMARHAVGRVRILKVDVVRLGDMDEAEAKLEGFPTFYDFQQMWIELNRKWDPNIMVKRVEFELVEQLRSICSCCDGMGTVAI